MISDKTEAHVVELKLNSDRTKALINGGVDIGRPGLYGNPSAFGTTRDTDVKTLVSKYRDWLMGEKYHIVEPDRRKQILESILKGDLDGKGLVCYAHGGGTCHGDVLADFIKDKSLAQKALKLPDQGINDEIIKMEGVMFDDSVDFNQDGRGIIGGQLNVNDREIEYMMDVYAQFGAGYNSKINKTVMNAQVRKFIGEKLWEDMTIEERKKEFFDKLKEDIEFTDKYVLENNKINYFLDRATDPLDPMAGFYKLLLVKLGATVTEDGKIKISHELKESLESNILRHKKVIDIVSSNALDQSLKFKPANMGLSLKLKVDQSI
jgi:hypothetical protein